MIPPLHTIGRVAGTHGFNGEISITLAEGISDNVVQKGDFIFISFDGKGVPFLVEQYQSKSGVLRICDISSEKDAKELEGRYLLIEKEKIELVETFDIEGYTVYDGTFELGRIVGTESFPAGVMLLIEGSAGELLIPFVEDWISEADEIKRTIRMTLPEGLTDLNR